MTANTKEKKLSKKCVTGGVCVTYFSNVALFKTFNKNEIDFQSLKNLTFIADVHERASKSRYRFSLVPQKLQNET